MKKLNLQLGSIKEMLTKEQMKQVSGGGYCYFAVNDDCGGGSIPFICDYSDTSVCQKIGDGVCADDNCCDGFTC